MVGAIDAVCAQASRIIGRLTAGTTSADAALLRVVASPTAGGKAGRGAPPRKARGSRTSGRDDARVPPQRSDAPPDERRRKSGRKVGALKKPAKRSGKGVDVATPRATTAGETPLRIPFGNKETALELGARYRAGGWYAPLGVDLSGFRDRGWL
jgi:DNA topoisomerase-3